MTRSVGDRIAEIYTAESRRVLATLVRLLGDLDQAEEALQEAFHAALTTWPREGIPRNPCAWLVSAGKFKGIDAIRRRKRGAELILEVLHDAPTCDVPQEWDGNVVRDDQLRLIFACCHPFLSVDARIALSLRVVCGLTTEEVAGAFLVSPGAMKKRITRAKAIIRKKQLPYEVPSHAGLDGRLNAVLRVIYLIYNEAYSATSGPDHQRPVLAAEALSLARLLADLLPEPETAGLLALLLLHESRSAARTDAQGDPISLEDQDRALWDRGLAAEGIQLVWKSLLTGRLARRSGDSMKKRASPALLSRPAV